MDLAPGWGPGPCGRRTAGHSDPAITLRVYAHVLLDQTMEAADVFARLLRPGREAACQHIREQAPARECTKPQIVP